MDRVKALLSWLKDLALRGFAIFQANKMSVYSGYATLFIVTAIFPCIILIISIVNLLPGYSTKDVADIFFQILPDLGPIREFVESMMTNLKSQSGGLLASAAAVTTLWSASKVMYISIEKINIIKKIISIKYRCSVCYAPCSEVTYETWLNFYPTYSLYCKWRE